MGFNKENSYYLLVGVGKREKDSEAMAVSAKDADYLKRALKAFNLFGDEKIAPLVNEEATKSGILEKLDFLAKSTKNKSADLVIIFFSGHGSKIGDNYYLICRDTSADIKNTAIEGSVFVEKLKKIQCDKMLVLLDCCHAEGITDTDIPRMTDKDIPFNDESFNDQKFKNRVILTACSASQVSYLSNPVSLFTYAVIETLGGKWLEENEKEVNIFNLAMNVRERVVSLSKKALQLEKPQQPRLNVLPESETTNFVLASYPLGGPQEVRLLKEELSSIKSYDKKEIDLTVAKGRDEEEREKFNWMLTSISVQISGDKGINVKDSNGNAFIINYGISEETLKDILNGLEAKDKIIEKLEASLQHQNDTDSKNLLKKVKKINVVSKFSDIVDTGRKKIITTLIKKRVLILDEIEKETGNTLITLKVSLDDNTEKIRAYGIDVDELGIPDLKSIDLK